MIRATRSVVIGVVTVALAGCGSTKPNGYSARQVVAAAGVISAGCNPAHLSQGDEWATLAGEILPDYRAQTKNGTAAICVTTTGDTAEMTVITIHGDKIADRFYQFTKINGRWKPA